MHLQRLDSYSGLSVGDEVVRGVVRETGVLVFLRTLLVGDGHPLTGELAATQLADAGDDVGDGGVGLERQELLAVGARRCPAPTRRPATGGAQAEGPTPSRDRPRGARHWRSSCSPRPGGHRDRRRSGLGPAQDSIARSQLDRHDSVIPTIAGTSPVEEWRMARRTTQDRRTGSEAPGAPSSEPAAQTRADLYRGARTLEIPGVAHPSDRLQLQHAGGRVARHARPAVARFQLVVPSGGVEEVIAHRA